MLTYCTTPPVRTMDTRPGRLSPTAAACHPPALSTLLRWLATPSLCARLWPLFSAVTGGSLGGVAGLLGLFIWDASLPVLIFFFFNDTATTEIYTLSLHDALPIFTDEDRIEELRLGPA